MRKMLVSLATVSLCAASIAVAGGGQGQTPVNPGQGQTPVNPGQGQTPVNPGQGEPTYSTNPFNLAHLAYRGELYNQGIAGYNGFCSQWVSGEVDAEDIAAAGVASRRVRASDIDRGYISALDMHLGGLCGD